MNCKPGDMAVIVPAPDEHDESCEYHNIGTVVDVVGPPEVMGQGWWHCRCRAEDARLTVESIYRPGLMYEAREADIADANLKPIRGLGVEDAIRSTEAVKA